MFLKDIGKLANHDVAFNVLVSQLPAQSVAGIVSTTHQTNAETVYLPRVSKDPATEWLSEGEEINPSAPMMEDVEAEVKKVAGLTVLSNEALADAAVDLGQLVGAGLVRDIAAKVDAAFFGPEQPKAPAGLETLVDAEGAPSVQTIGVGASWDSLDPFEEALSLAADTGATINHFVAHPADALALGKIKKATGSNESLLSPDPSQPAGRLISGVPLLRSRHVTEGTIWALPADRIFFVVREDATLNVSQDAFFSSDRFAVRATMRVGFAFLSPESIVKLNLSA